MHRSWSQFLYGCYAWLALIIVVVPVAILFMLLPGMMRRRRLAKQAARLVAVLTFSPVKVTGWPIPDGLACILVANHSSYLDGLVLTAALPARFAFLIKQEIAAVPIAGYVLRRLGAEFVDRDNPRDRHRMARRLVDTAKRGWTLAVFPEGTFTVEPGLRRFHSGAFTAALKGGLPIVPVVIKGAREKMPGEYFMARTGALSVHVCDPIDSLKFDSVEALIRATRAAMLDVLGEPDLADATPAEVP